MSFKRVKNNMIEYNIYKLVILIFLSLWKVYDISWWIIKKILDKGSKNAE